ncbi:trypsin-like peptidase domain-containing protein [Pontibacter aydingkolensis]|uniref:Trypsin-like peptidase domain-containing protein n=2 Tax=Pontibacter aydingkolensis TaxID=1911536 RepID=A0ABS7CYY6_9BACT|nr:trypsin-like peptidase domain-containing protein [Pontibacter aydingkolensis]
MKSAGLVILIALLSAALAIAGYRYFDNRESISLFGEENRALLSDINPSASVSSAGNPDFVRAAAMVTPAVVHINTQYDRAVVSGNPFYGNQAVPAHGSGSGVLISPDGYVVTNNHVIENASAIEVVLPDKRTFSAKLIGRDPDTDLALVKVKGSDLPVVPLGNSDSVQVGEWVLAVGYPFSLNSTVTAGIISAKGRSIGILNRQSQDYYADPSQPGFNTAIESFIQTDAAINRGNSGGALVNTDGKLIGINAAIASQTGSYAGYGFAIPVNLMRKIVNDFRKYGEVRRGYLGVSFPAPAAEDDLLRQLGVDPASVKGVYVTGIQSGSGAAAAGLKEGDIIQKIDGVSVTSSSELSERIARYNPGDKVQLTFLRDGRTRSANVVLKGEEEARRASGAERSEDSFQARLGATFAPVPDRMKQQYRLRSGVYVTAVQRNGFFFKAGIPEGTIITSINGIPVNNTSDMEKAIAATRNNMVRIVGITPDGAGFVFSIPLGA